MQGINDLATPFLVVFLSEHVEGSIDNWMMSDLPSEKISGIEADCYWCLSKLLDGMQDHYTFAQPGIQRLVFKLKELVRRIDGNAQVVSTSFFVSIYCPMLENLEVWCQKLLIFLTNNVLPPFQSICFIDFLVFLEKRVCFLIWQLFLTPHSTWHV